MIARIWRNFLFIIALFVVISFVLGLIIGKSSSTTETPSKTKTYLNFDDKNLAWWRKYLNDVKEGYCKVITNDIGVKYIVHGIGKSGMFCSRYDTEYDYHGTVIKYNFDLADMKRMFPDHFDIRTVTENQE
jgi:hypothetical protein